MSLNWFKKSLEIVGTMFLGILVFNILLYTCGGVDLLYTNDNSRWVVLVVSTGGVWLIRGIIALAELD